MSDGILGTSRVWSGTGPWHLAWKLVKLLPMGPPSQDRDAGSNPADGATKLLVEVFREAFRRRHGRDGKPLRPLICLGERRVFKLAGNSAERMTIRDGRGRGSRSPVRRGKPVTEDSANQWCLASDRSEPQEIAHHLGDSVGLLELRGMSAAIHGLHPGPG